MYCHPDYNGVYGCTSGDESKKRGHCHCLHMKYEGLDYNDKVTKQTIQKHKQGQIGLAMHLWVNIMPILSGYV